MSNQGNKTAGITFPGHKEKKLIKEVSAKQGAVDAHLTSDDPKVAVATQIHKSVKTRLDRFCADKTLKKGEVIEKALTHYMNSEGFEL